MTVQEAEKLIEAAKQASGTWGRLPPMCEITRSFTFKLNVGNYESRDFFCSQKVTVPLAEAEEASKRVFDFCRKEVMRDVMEYKKQHGVK